MKRIGGILGRSPFGPIYEHTAKVMDCLDHILPLMKAVVADDEQELKRHTDAIVELEGEADRIKNEIRTNLSTSVFQAIERSEILFLLQRQDRISDSCEAVAKLLDVRKTRVPAALSEDLLNYTARVVETARFLSELMRNLQGSISFSRKEISSVDSMVARVHQSEHTCDELNAALLKKLFSKEKELDPVTVMFLMDMVKRLDEIANETENTADCVIRMVLLH